VWGKHTKKFALGSQRNVGREGRGGKGGGGKEKWLLFKNTDILYRHGGGVKRKRKQRPEKCEGKTCGNKRQGAKKGAVRGMAKGGHPYMKVDGREKTGSTQKSLRKQTQKKSEKPRLRSRGVKMVRRWGSCLK